MERTHRARVMYLALGLALAGFLPRRSEAAAAPYTDWAFDAKRATDAGDMKRLGALAKQTPQFARIWFYGLVFDLVTIGVPDAVKQKLRPQLDTIAGVLEGFDPPMLTPRLYLDYEASGQLDPLAAKTRKAQDDLINIVRTQREYLPAVSAVLDQLDVSSAMFFGLMYRIELAGKRLGGQQERELLERAARRIAEAVALAKDDLGPWSALASFQGGKVSTLGASVVEAQVAAGLNQLQAGQAAAARKTLRAALHTATASRGPSVYTVLVQNGIAHAADRAGDHRGAQQVRLLVLQAIRPLGQPYLVAQIARQMVRSHIAEKEWVGMLPYTRELRELGASVTQAADVLLTLLRAARVLAKAGAADLERGELARADQLYQEAQSIFTLLKAKGAVVRTDPGAKAEPARLLRERGFAQIRLDRARIAERRGRFDQALTLINEAREILDAVVGDPVATAACDIRAAQVQQAAGLSNEAIERAHAAQARLSDPSLASARSRRVLGRVRLQQMEYAPAFANANQGLEDLRIAAKGEWIDDAEREAIGTERMRLHELAGITLHAAGHPRHAAERLAFAFGVRPTRYGARLLAMARLDLGDTAGALAALEPLGGEAVRDPRDVDARIDQIYRGCGQARAGDHAGAVETLRRRVPSLTLPHLRPFQILGRTCLTAAYIAQGKLKLAEKALTPARALVLEHGDPELTWRVMALDGELQARAGRWLGAAGAWRRAVDRWVDAGADGRPIPLDHRLPGMPVTIDAVARALPGALVKAAARDRKSAETHHAAAVAYALWARQRGWLTNRSGLPRVGRDVSPALAARTSQALAEAQARRRIVRDPSIVNQDRVAASRGLARAFTKLSKATAKMAKAFPSWGTYGIGRPARVQSLVPPEGEAHVYFYLEEKIGHLWLWPAKAAGPKYYPLPGRAKLAALLAPALEVVLGEPKAWPKRAGKRRPKDPNRKDWKILAKPVSKLLPFLTKRGLTKRGLTKRGLTKKGGLSAQTLRLFPDGLLSRFPFGALVLKAPSRKAPGSPPVFLATRYALRIELLPGLPPGPVRGEAEKSLAVLGAPAPGQGCTKSRMPDLEMWDLCRGADLAAEVEQVRAAAGGEAVTVWADERLVPETVRNGLEQHGALHVATPIDAATGELLIAPPVGSASYGRYGPGLWARAESRAQIVTFSRISPRPLAEEDGAGVGRLLAAARFDGAQAIVRLLYRDGRAHDNQIAAELAKASTSATALEAAFDKWKGTQIATSVDPTAGGIARYHPYYWARWQLVARP